MVQTTDSAPSTTYAYDASKDPRGVETSRTDSVVGTSTAAYDDGNLTTQSLPGGYTVTVSQDATGARASRVYTQGRRRCRRIRQHRPARPEIGRHRYQQAGQTSTCAYGSTRPVDLLSKNP
ncbi:hypothetical protein ACWEQ1_35780 [Streptomyces nodosus]